MSEMRFLAAVTAHATLNSEIPPDILKTVIHCVPYVEAEYVNAKITSFAWHSHLTQSVFIVSLYGLLIKSCQDIEPKTIDM